MPDKPVTTGMKFLPAKKFERKANNLSWTDRLDGRIKYVEKTTTEHLREDKTQRCIVEIEGKLYVSRWE